MAKIPSVQKVVGLEISDLDIGVARANAKENCVEQKLSFFHADSFVPFDAAARKKMNQLAGQVDFLIANPPASDGDDGFQMRRNISASARKFLKPGAPVCIQVSIQYGFERVSSLANPNTGLKYERLLASTPWVPFDLGRADLRELIDQYSLYEQESGTLYQFGNPDDGGVTTVDARTATRVFHKTGQSPLTKWQVHLFFYGGSKSG